MVCGAGVRAAAEAGETPAPQGSTPAPQGSSRRKTGSWSTGSSSISTTRSASGNRTSISPRGSSIRNELGIASFRSPRKSRYSARLICSRCCGARDADEHQPPLFLQLLGHAAAPLVRQEALLDGHEIDAGKLQPLRGVQRHQRDAIELRFPLVGVVHQRRFFQECLQVARARMPLVELPRDGEQFLDVGQAFLVFFIARAP